MIITPTKIPDVLVIEPKVFGDNRDFFFECCIRWDAKELAIDWQHNGEALV